MSSVVTRRSALVLVAATCITSSAGGVIAGDADQAFPDSVSEVAWTADLSAAPSRVIAVRDTVIAMTDDDVVALDAGTGDVAWRFESPTGPIDVLGAPASDVALVVTETIADRWTITGVDAASGEERFSWDTPAFGGRPHETIGVTADFALMPDMLGTFTATSLDTGEEAWSVELPESCPLFVYPAALATTSSFVIACGTVDPVARQVVSGGYVAFDDRTGSIGWTDVRDGMQATPNARPTASPDGELVRLEFAESGQAGLPPSAWPIVDAATGEVVAPDNLVGKLGIGGWFAHRASTVFNGEYENLRTGERMTIEAPCGCGVPVAFLADGIVWWRPPRDDHASTVRFLDIGGGSSGEIEIDARLEWAYAAVGAGLVVLTNSDSAVLVALR